MSALPRLKLWIVTAILAAYWLGWGYISLFTDAKEMAAFVHGGGGNFAIITTLIVLVFASWHAVKLMDIAMGDNGLTKLQKFVAAGAGAFTVGFALQQFMAGVGSSSAELATVAVEVLQQLTHFIKTGEMEPYGLVGMLTSDASGPWNGTVFPMLLIIFWFFARRKMVRLEKAQLDYPMLFMFILYIQQWLFSLDNSYSMLEIVMMFLSSSIFVVGMFSFAVSLFRRSEEELEAAMEEVGYDEDNEEEDNSLMGRLAEASYEFFQLNNTVNNRVDTRLGKIPRWYIYLFMIKLGVVMTFAMFSLVGAAQFMMASTEYLFGFALGDAEAALFITSSITSVPEMILALGQGPIISALLLVGSNVIDGWGSAIGQLILVSYGSWANGELMSLELAEAIRYLTFLSWSQGAIAWFFMRRYADAMNRQGRVWLATLELLIVLVAINVYYFGGALLVAQYAGNDARWPMEFAPFAIMVNSINWLSTTPAQGWFMNLNILGVITLILAWSGVYKRILAMIQGIDNAEEALVLAKIRSAMEARGHHSLTSQVVIALDMTEGMQKYVDSGALSKFFEMFAALGYVVDDNGHIPVFKHLNGVVTRINQMLNLNNGHKFFDDEVTGECGGTSSHASVLQALLEDEEIRAGDDPILVLYLTAEDEPLSSQDDIQPILEKLADLEKPFFIQTIALHNGKVEPAFELLHWMDDYEGVNGDATGLTIIDLNTLADVVTLVTGAFNEYPGYLKAYE